MASAAVNSSGLQSGLQRGGSSSSSARRLRSTITCVAAPEKGTSGSAMRAEDFVRPHLLKLKAYTPIEPFEILAQRLGREAKDIVKLDANENPYGPPPEVLAALGSMSWPNIYPDPESRRLREGLAQWHGVPAEHLLVSWWGGGGNRFAGGRRRTGQWGGSAKAACTVSTRHSCVRMHQVRHSDTTSAMIGLHWRRRQASSARRWPPAASPRASLGRVPSARAPMPHRLRPTRLPAPAQLPPPPRKAAAATRPIPNAARRRRRRRRFCPSGRLRRR